MARIQWAREFRERELGGTLVFGIGLLAAAALNFVFISAMGRLLPSDAFATLGVLIAALLAITAPVNALQGGTEMFAALHDRFPRGPRRLLAPAIGVAAWAATMAVPSGTARAAGWFVLGSSALLLLSWNRGALAGLGRFSFVGFSFVVDGGSRLFLALALVGVGLGLSGAAAGYALGIILALVVTEAAVPRMSSVARQPLGRDVLPALLGLFVLGVTQIVDVFAIRLANPPEAAAYVGAASLARLALFAQMPAAAYALRRAAVEGPRRALPRTALLALGPALVAVALLEAAPAPLLRLAYAGRYTASVPTLRVLAVAMFFGGLAAVGAQFLMGARSTAWAWSVVPVGAIGAPAVIGLAHAQASVALFSLLIQAGALAAVAVPVWAAVRSGESCGRSVLIFNWRDTGHPQGGGSEVYVEEVAGRLARGGWRVTVFCGAYPGAPPEEVRDGVRFVRRGGWRSVYLWAFTYHLLGRLGPHEVVLDVKNGIPFFSPWYCRRPVICLVHHVHREQWRMNFSRGWARFGWWVESRLAVRAYRGSRHVAVSDSTRRELADLGIPPAFIDVVHNGTQPPGDRPGPRAPVPTIVVLGRLVPHKRVDLVLEAAAVLRAEVPALRVLVVGQGPWDAKLRTHAEALGLRSTVEFTGWVDETRKRAILAEAWVLAMPSVKEGWGLAVMEAAGLGTPAVGFRSGGLQECIVEDRTGLLVDRPEEFTAALRRLLTDDPLRRRLGEHARDRSAAFSWERTAEGIEVVLAEALRARATEPATAALRPSATD